MDSHTPCWLVVNPASGSNDQTSAETLTAALTARGWPVDRVVAFPDDPLPDAAAMQTQTRRTNLISRTCS